MRLYSYGLLSIATGILLLLYGGFEGGLLIIFPFIVTSSLAGAMGILMIMLGLMAVFLSIYGSFTYAAGYEDADFNSEEKKRGLAFIMVGPVPLVLDTDNRRLSIISLAIFITGIIIFILIVL